MVGCRTFSFRKSVASLFGVREIVLQREAIVESAMRIAIASLLLVMVLRFEVGRRNYAAADHTFTEFLPPTPASRPSAITTGPDGALWFTEYYGSRVGRLVLP